MLLALLIPACAQPPSAQVEALGKQPTSSLCTAHVAASGADLLAIEAELGVRGALQCKTTYGSTSYVGQRTAGSVGRPLYARSTADAAAGDDRNCSDFVSAAEAQRFFIANGGPTRDPHRLDGDGDGNACEWGRTLKSSVAKYRPKPVQYTAPRRSTPTCHTGPRGGRFYYSASGNKVYGC
ncbi:excalibur calcium-binding domain-containing protein [Frigidibacter mobilis]|nr:excalibur calcium-binding domain-containing protein [Frigidibacter mobilis]